MPRRRAWKISLPKSRFSISSQKLRSFFITCLVSAMKPGRQVVLEAADAVEVGVEAAARDRLDEVQHVLAVAERHEHRGDGTELHAEVAEEQRDVRDARELEQDGADPLGTRRCLDVHQLLGGEDEWHLVGEAAQPVDAVDERRHLRERAHLGELLVAAVHVAGAGLGPDHLLAVEADDDAQRAVRGRVLRADVEGHALGLELDVQARIGGLGGDVAELLTIGEIGHASPPSRLSSPGSGSTSTMPGHGFTRRASSGKSLRSGCPSKSMGRYMLRRSGWPLKPMPNISWHSRSCQLAPA